MMADEDDGVGFWMGEVFCNVTCDEAEELREKEQKKVSEAISQLSNDIDIGESKKTELKAKLKSKFGESINLEEKG